MSLDRVPAGKDVPNDCNVIIEIPMRGDPIKYEIDKETGAIFVDRFMSTAMHYPCNTVTSRAHSPVTAIPATCWCSRRCR